ncbi:MAG: KTSC domain-containing protein [Sphingobacteriales bacterium]|nr:KTSC domain-containing protein [Sphingobacteriales bacterium]
MKKINDYRKLFEATPVSTLADLKTTYRNFMKAYHPDKFQDETEKANAEEKSREMIEAYHFLVSIAPETIEALMPEFKETIMASNISDYQWKGLVLEITFLNGSSYEFFNVPKNTYIKLVNSDSPARFAKRHIYNEFSFRKLSNVEMA